MPVCLFVFTPTPFLKLLLTPNVFTDSISPARGLSESVKNMGGLKDIEGALQFAVSLFMP